TVRGGIEQHQMSDLVSLLESIVLSSSNDRWVCGLSDDGDFKVKDIRIFLDDLILPHFEPPRWIKAMPIKINIFTWQARKDCLPTRMNLLQRDININSVLCPVCVTNDEDAHRLFFRCDLAQHVLRRLCRWWDLDTYGWSSFHDWLSWFSTIRYPSLHQWFRVCPTRHGHQSGVERSEASVVVEVETVLTYIRVSPRTAGGAEVVAPREWDGSWERRVMSWSKARIRACRSSFWSCVPASHGASHTLRFSSHKGSKHGMDLTQGNPLIAPINGWNRTKINGPLRMVRLLATFYWKIKDHMEELRLEADIVFKTKITEIVLEVWTGYGRVYGFGMGMTGFGLGMTGYDWFGRVLQDMTRFGPGFGGYDRVLRVFPGFYRYISVLSGHRTVLALTRPMVLAEFTGSVCIKFSAQVAFALSFQAQVAFALSFVIQGANMGSLTV
nr:RNA-directed DNA polymerase, eukaryota [Tanacetum cinerariifolium]